jgi:hypothetical protein
VNRRQDNWNTMGTRVIVGGSYIKDDFVQELQRVTQEHERHNPEVDPAAQLCHVDGFTNHGILMAIKIFPGSINFRWGTIGGRSFRVSDVDSVLGIGPVNTVFSRDRHNGQINNRGDRTKEGVSLYAGSDCETTSRIEVKSFGYPKNGRSDR